MACFSIEIWDRHRVDCKAGLNAGMAYGSMSGRRDCHGLDYPRPLKYRNKEFPARGQGRVGACTGPKTGGHDLGPGVGENGHPDRKAVEMRHVRRPKRFKPDGSAPFMCGPGTWRGKILTPYCQAQ
jgi:hypothetical protein